ncbi:hypothetical protein ACP70R_032553 [Stipagrostis hirtigluma subsp. patula]
MPGDALARTALIANSLHPCSPSPPRSDCHYFVYRVGGKSGGPPPSLTLLQRPHSAFADEDVGLLRRADGHYTIAALLVTDEFGVYDLHRFDSATGRWSLVKVPMWRRRPRSPAGSPGTRSGSSTTSPPPWSPSAATAAPWAGSSSGAASCSATCSTTCPCRCRWSY